MASLVGLTTTVPDTPAAPDVAVFLRRLDGRCEERRHLRDGPLPQVVVLAGLLFWRKHLERFVQTLSALTAMGIIFNLITGALLSVSDPTVNQPILATVWFAVFIWSLFVDAHIYRHALSVPYAIGMLITVLVLAASYVLIEMVFLLGSS